MKKTLTFVSCFVLSVAPLFADETTAHHRALYKEINESVENMDTSKASVKREEGATKLTGWSDESGVRKIIAKQANGTVNEYYLEEEKPVFVFNVSKDDDGKKIEERLYFKDGEIIKWLTTDKNAPVYHAEDYQATAEAHTEACVEYIELLKNVGEEPVVLEGKFLGLEEGDYFHWRMKAEDGEEQSFFILQTTEEMEKVLENPEPFVGKKCRVTWKSSVEDIEQAGGKIKIDVLLSVEWLK